MYVKILENITATLKRGKGERSSLFSAICQDVPSNFVQDCRFGPQDEVTDSEIELTGDRQI